MLGVSHRTARAFAGGGEGGWAKSQPLGCGFGIGATCSPFLYRPQGRSGMLVFEEPFAVSGLREAAQMATTMPPTPSFLTGAADCWFRHQAPGPTPKRFDLGSPLLPQLLAPDT